MQVCDRARLSLATSINDRWVVGDKKSALRLMQTLVQDNSQVTLALQQQMANENKSLEENGRRQRASTLKSSWKRKKFEKSLAEAQGQTAEGADSSR